MKNLIQKALIEELFNLDELHEEYSDSDSSYVIDSKRDGNKLIITITLNENEDKKEFEKYLENVSDELFQEALESLEGENIKNLEEMYRSEHYPIVIEKVTSKIKELANKKIEDLKKLI